MLETEQARAAISSQEKRHDELNAEMKAKDDIVAKSQADIKRRNVKRKQALLRCLRYRHCVRVAAGSM